MIVLRARADPAYVLSVTQNACKNGGWVTMWEQGGLPEECSQWELGENGVLRARADPRYALCVTHQGCQNGGWLHLWDLGDQADIYGQWIIHDGELRAKADPRYSLCVRRDGCTNGGYLHMWSFGGPPDVYGQWEIVEAQQSLTAETRLADELAPGAHANQEGEPLNRQRASALEPAVRHLKEALTFDIDQQDPMVIDLDRAALIAGLEAFGQALNKLGGGIGMYVLSEVDKFRKAQADNDEGGYQSWLFSELPVHAAVDFEDFVEVSACMANLWVARNLDFFVQFLSLLRDGLETSVSVDMAYRKTLLNHHDIFQRIAFMTAAIQLPNRQRVLQVLEGEAYSQNGLRELGALVTHGRRIVHVCKQIDKEIQAQLQEQQQRLEMDRAYGRAGW